MHDPNTHREIQPDHALVVVRSYQDYLIPPVIARCVGDCLLKPHAIAKNTWAIAEEGSVGALPTPTSRAQLRLRQGLVEYDQIYKNDLVFRIDFC